MIKNIAFIVTLFISLLSNSAISAEIKTFHNGDLEIVWLQDERFPTYTIAVYFADGAASDARNEVGLTSAMFNLLSMGTTRYNQQQLADILEFFAVTPRSEVNHEYVTFTYQGLIKDLMPTTKIICHMFQEATFPQAEVSKLQQIAISGLENLISEHGALADRVFRQLSLTQTPFSAPADGTIATIKSITPEKLQQQRTYFNEQVKKRIFISGPRDALDAVGIFTQECKWKNHRKSISREIDYQAPKMVSTPAPFKQTVYLLPVKGANQAQIRIGRFLAHTDPQAQIVMDLTSSLLGGGFTSLLNQELRVKRGLTYGIYAVAVAQRSYGRSFISTFTKNSSLVEALDTIEQTLHLAAQSFAPATLEKTRNYLAGTHLFRLEKSEDYLIQLLFAAHVGRDFDDLVDYAKNIRRFQANDVSNAIVQYFNWSDMTLVIVGNESLEADLKKANYQVVKLNPAQYL